MSRKRLIEQNDIIPISEWPVLELEAENNQSDTNKSCAEKNTDTDFLSNHVDHSNSNSNANYKHVYKRHKATDSSELEPLVSVRVAKWLRKNKCTHLLADSGAATSPNTKLFHISRTKECIQFLNDERNELLKKSSDSQFQSRGDKFAALASIEDWLQNYSKALENINVAVELCPNCSDYVWLKKKLQKQCKVQNYQSQRLYALKNSIPILPDFIQVERISARSLTIEDFIRNYVDKRQPVILVDIIPEITKTPWDLDYVKSKAGSQTVTVKKAVTHSVEWARLEDSRTIRVAEFIEAVQKNETTEYLFDWSLPLHCPDLAQDIITPRYFEKNFLVKTSPESLYHDSWPSLFIAPKGVNSNLHVDAFASNFWMVLFQGQKRWTFFDAEDIPLLYPVYFHSMDPVFSVNLEKPNLEEFPLLSLTKPRQCVLNPGELLFVPSGSPHFVENLTATLAVSSNHVSFSNYKQVCKELKVNSLIDPRSKDLLEQFEDPQFLERINRT